YLADAPDPVVETVAPARPVVGSSPTALTASVAPCVSLRVAVPETPPVDPPPPPPEAYLPDEYSVSPTAPARCKYHPKSVARWLCASCQLHFCELWVTTRPGGTRT